MFKPVKCPPGCKYAMVLSGAGEKATHCGYVLVEDELRGCDPGPGCVRYERGPKARSAPPKIRKQRVPKYSWDERAGFRMWLEGKKDREIADALGTDREKVAKARRRKWSVGCRRFAGSGSG